MKRNWPLKAGDFLIFAAILALACGIWLRLALMQSEQTYGEILVDGELYRQVRLGGAAQETISFKGRTGEVTIEIDGDRMRFVSSSCPDHTCERTGWISRAGQSAVCLPNRVMLRITGGDSGGVDAIAQ